MLRDVSVHLGWKLPGRRGDARGMNQLRTRFQVCTVDLYRHAPHDQVQRDHHPQGALPTQHNAGQSRKRPSADENLLANRQVGVRFNLAEAEGGA